MLRVGTVRRSGWRNARTAAAIGIAVGLATAAMPLTAAAANNSAPRPTPVVIDWQPCVAGFECGTMPVPLDYDHPRGRQISIAVIRSHAADPTRRIGSVVFNPGGPGGAGTTDLPGLFASFPSEVRNRFDLVSFDPRGIGQSTAVQCFATSADESAFLAHAPAAFPVGAREERQWIRTYRGFSEQCERRIGVFLKHISTADAARDMDQLRAALGEATLRFIGLSYGTLLGATYANLFPDRVGALVLDGNVDPVAWFNNGDERAQLGVSLRLESDLGTADVVSQFLDHCGALPATQCPFSAGSPTATRAKFAQLLARLRIAPVTFSGITVTYAVAVSIAADFVITVGPIPATAAKPTYPGWGALAGLLEQFWQLSSSPAPTAAARPAASAAPRERYAGANQGLAVACSEAPMPRDTDRYRALAAFSFGRAGDVGPFWTWGTDELCATWPARADDAYAGPWNQRTAAPILVVGNRHDPQTPYSDSLAMVRRLRRARLLTVEGFGHTAMLNPSDCANSAIVDYLVDGRLPPNGTACPQTVQPFAG